MKNYFSERLAKSSYLSSIDEQSHKFNDYTTINNNEYSYNYKYKTLSQKNFNKSKTIERKVMESLLKEMDKKYNINLNNINSINFIYQIYDKGINIINHKDTNFNKTQYVANCLRKNKFNSKLINQKKFFYIPENRKDNSFNENNKNFSPNKLNKNLRFKFKVLQKPLKKSNSCDIKESNTNQKNNFILLPLKNILLKKKIENCHHAPVKKAQNRTSIIYKKKNVLEEEKKREYKEFLKVFSQKYEKEKEDFSNILFDEGIEFRKKKFKLDSFIQKFTNKHFVEHLYRIKENALHKEQ